MEIVIPPRDHARSSVRYTWDDEGHIRNVEPLERIQESPDMPDDETEARPTTRSTMLKWPFHRRGASEVPSTPLTARMRAPLWQSRSFLRTEDDSLSMTSKSLKSLIPDYVVNYMRGETPETLRRRKERERWGEKLVEVTAHRETFYSHTPELGDANQYRDGNHLLPHDRDNQQRGLRRFYTGWRGGTILNTILSFLVLLVAIISFILAATKTGLVSGQVVLFSGACSTAVGTNIGLHVAINILTVVLLAGANYVFQVLSSPTRAEVAAAHEKKRWLDIGVPSIRNLLHISGFRSFLAILILLTAVATQVIYNSVIFTSKDTFNYDVVFVTESFLDGAQFSNDSAHNLGSLDRIEILSLQEQAAQKRLVNLTTDTCIQEFSNVFETSFDAVLLVTNTTSPISSLVQTSKPGTSLATLKAPDFNETSLINDLLVEYCLARPATTEATCSVTLSGSLIGIVALLNLVTVTSVGVVVLMKWGRLELLVTLGDAVRSFLRNPDATTAGSCLMTKADVRQSRWGFREAKYFEPGNDAWFAVPSIPRWMLFAISWAIVAGPTAAALAISLMRSSSPGAQGGTTATTGSGLAAGFGAVATSNTTFPLPVASASTGPQFSAPQTALIGALPQLLLAALYLATNSLLTTYYLSRESSLFGVGPQPLRVSAFPAGHQTTSLYLTLPRPVSWALLLVFAAMGFVLSQAVFPVLVAPLAAAGATQTAVPTVATAGPMAAAAALAPRPAIGLNSAALLTLLALLAALLLAVVGLGFRRAPPPPQSTMTTATTAGGRGNPLVLRGGSCSAVISARCQTRVRDREQELWREPLAWGVVDEAMGMQVGRCGFSHGHVGAIVAGRSYA